LVLFDPANLSHCNDGTYSLWSSLLADSCFNGSDAGYIYGICLDGCKGLPHRYPYVWKENLMERDVEMAQVQRLKV
jgi:hypothetical protein